MRRRFNRNLGNQIQSMEQTSKVARKEKKTTNVFTEFRDGFTATGPLPERKYTITHSDTTGDLFVVIGKNYAEDKIDLNLRDEVRLKWIRDTRRPALVGCVLIDGDGQKRDSKVRKEIFLRELPTALKGVRRADQVLFEEIPSLDQAQVMIQFESNNPMYVGWYSFGTIGDYK